jgi:protein-S-isoprenylcysteine O-methyltransferase Ste14
MMLKYFIDTNKGIRFIVILSLIGETLIFAAFAKLAMTWFALIPLAAFILFYWIPNMIRKDKLRAAIPGFQDYKKKTRSFLPFVF